MNRGSVLSENVLRPLVSVLLLSAAAVSVSCSSSLGEAPFDLLAEGVSEPVACSPTDDLRFVTHCPVNPYVSSATADDAFTILKDVASAAFGVDCRWVGRIAGVGIGRDGRNLNSGLSGWSISWVGGESNDPDMLVMDTTGGVCMVQNRCACVSSGTCPGFDPADLESLTQPAVDSPAAIAAAFPDDPESTKYDLNYDGVTGLWTVARAATTPPPADVNDTPDVVVSDAAPDVATDAATEVSVPDVAADVEVSEVDQDVGTDTTMDVADGPIGTDSIFD